MEYSRQPEAQELQVIRGVSSGACRKWLWQSEQETINIARPLAVPNTQGQAVLLLGAGKYSSDKDLKRQRDVCRPPFAEPDPQFGQPLDIHPCARQKTVALLA